MIVLALVRWWYTAGWAGLAERAGHRFNWMLESFSVGLLLRTLFDPFRQIDADSVNGPADVQLKAFGDRLFSRVFGALIRGMFIGIGLLCALVMCVAGFVQIVVWPVIPLLPLVGLVAALAGWTL